MLNVNSDMKYEHVIKSAISIFERYNSLAHVIF